MGYWKIIEPAAATNIMPNPSFENGTTGWSNGGSGSTSQSSSYATHGVYSMQINVAALGELATYSYSANLFSANTSYIVSFWCRFQEDWDGSNTNEVTITQNNITGDTITMLNSATAAAATLGQWQYVSAQIDFASDVTGELEITISTGSAPVSNDNIWVDGFMIVEGTDEHTYIDGDQGEGYFWSGLPHASTSYRLSWVADSGIILDFDDDLSMPIEDTTGVGYPPVVNLSQEQPQIPGNYFTGRNIQQRDWSLQTSAIGTSQSNYHSVRQRLVKLLNDGNVFHSKEPFQRRLRYTGASTAKDIYAVYKDGLHVASQKGFNESPFSLQLSSPDPLFYAIHEQSVALDNTDSATFRYISNRNLKGNSTSIWTTPTTDAATTFTFAYDLLYDPNTGYIWVAGDFDDWNAESSIDSISYYDGTDWFSVTSSGAPNNIVITMEVDNDGNIWAAGAFTSINAVTTRIAYWDGAAWNDADNGFTSGTIYKLYNLNGTMYACTSSSSDNYFLSWDGTTWSTFDGGVNGSVRDMVSDNNGGFYISGQFTTVNGGATSATRIAHYAADGTWSALGEGLQNYTSYQGLVVASDGTLYAGGPFTSAGGDTSIQKLAKWNGSAWSPVGTGVSGGSGNVIAILLDEETDLLYVLGNFTKAGELGTLGDRVAIWNGSSFSHLDFNTPGSDSYFKARMVNRSIYFLFEEDGTATYSGTTSITYEGTAPAYPTVTIHRSGGDGATLKSLRNETTGASLFFDYDLADDETVTIYFQPGNRRMVSSINGERWDILPNSDVSDFYLVPGNGSSGQENIISLFVDEDNSPTVTSTLRWRDTFISYD